MVQQGQGRPRILSLSQIKFRSVWFAMSSVINSCPYLQHWVALSSILSIPPGISLPGSVYVYLCMIQSLAFSEIISGRFIRLVAFQRSLGFSPYCIPAFISPSTEICSSTLRPRQFPLLEKQLSYTIRFAVGFIS